MVSVYGMAGYGWYWVIIEILRDEEDYKFNITKEHSYNAIAMQLYCDCNAAKKFIEDCINEFDLFVSDGENFWSESLLNRMSILANKRQKMKDNADKRWSNQDKTITTNAIAMQKQCKSNASKVKESKVKESKDIYPEILEYWNSKEIIAHKVLSSKSITLIKSKLESGYTIDDIKEAIKSYWFITTNPETKDSFWFTYKFTLEDFLNPKNFEKFKDFEAAHTNFLIKEEKKR
jgi:hypothetical protein